jgi:hypothetical protein
MFVFSSFPFLSLVCVRRAPFVIARLFDGRFGATRIKTGTTTNKEKVSKGRDWRAGVRCEQLPVHVVLSGVGF